MENRGQTWQLAETQQKANLDKIISRYLYSDGGEALKLKKWHKNEEAVKVFGKQLNFSQCENIQK